MAEDALIFSDSDIHELRPDYLKGPEVKRIMLAEAERARVLYLGIVAKRSGALAGSAAVSTEVGGIKHDRWIGRMTIGHGLEYGAAHEFGVGDHPRSIHNLESVSDQIVAAADDLEKVLGLMRG